MNATSRPFNRLVVTAGTVAVLTIVITIIVLLPDSILAQGNGPEQATPHPLQTGQPSPPPPLQINPPAATPEPGAVESSVGPQVGSSDLEVVKFRPDIRLRRGEVPPITAAEKPAGMVDQDSLEKPLGEAVGPQEAYHAPDIDGLLSAKGWTPLLYEDFEGVFPGDWILEDFSDDGYDRTWGKTDYKPQWGSWSAWPAAGGEDALDPWYYYYPNDLDSWMGYGPFDFSNMADVFVSFGLWYETEPEYDWIYFCASIDFVNYNCDYWSGYSGGWTDQAYWLTSYAGYSEVWLAWVFQSDFTIFDDGPFVDEIWVWGEDIGAPPTPTSTPDPGGQLIQNGSFETGDLTNWNSISSSNVNTLEDEVGLRLSLQPGDDQKSVSGGVSSMDDEVSSASVGVTNVTAVDGWYSAYLWRSGVGNDFLYQTFDVPSDITDLVLNYWFAVATVETEVGRDFFCASLRPADLSEIWVDVGCIDANDATGYWQQMIYTLDSGEVDQVKGETTALVFELYNDMWGTGSGVTEAWVDYVQVYATGGSGGSYIDPNEPNDNSSEATLINCGDTISGTIGDALGGYDIDWFELSNVPTGQLDIDIAADTKVPPSTLDSVVYLYEENYLDLDDWVAWNDDDSLSYDSYVVYTNTVDNANFYISVESYSGYGSADSFYDLMVQCAGSGSGPSPPGNPITPTGVLSWTVMLYLNAEDPNFEAILTQYRTDIETFIGNKSDFLNVAILYDGPDGSSNSGTTRYLAQPNGNYTPGTNRWDRGELNMGHPETLESFVSWAMDQYPAEHYYLAVDDHGDGAYGISFDETSNNDQLTPSELYSALKSATNNGARKIDIFDYEACLMGLTENAYDLRQWVDYVVFSEQISWGINTYPVYFSDLAATDTPLDVGRRIIDRYHAHANVANGRGYPHTISLIDTSQMEAVSNAVTSFGDAIRATDTQAQKDAINSARDNSQAFANDIDATNPARAEYIDLWDLADEASSLASSQAAAVKSAVNAAVVHERHASGGAEGYIWDHSGAHGLSIYYPPSNSASAFDSYVAPSLYQMSQTGTWDEFLNWAVPRGPRRGMTSERSTLKLTGGNTFVFKYLYLPMIMK